MPASLLCAPAGLACASQSTLLPRPFAPDGVHVLDHGGEAGSGRLSRHESALRAAEELNVSPPAISGAIAGLESILGEQLFVRRHARGLVLTEAGHHLLLEARDIIEQVWEIESIRSKSSRQMRSRIAFGCLGDIAPSLVPPLLRKFQVLHPLVEVAWQADLHPALMQRLEDGVLDVIFVMDFEISPTLHSTVLQPTPVQCVLPAGHPFAKIPVSLKDLADEPFIMLDVAKTRDYFLSVFGELGLQPNIAIRAPSAEMVRSLVANGFGYSLLNFSTAERHNVVYKPLEDKIRPSNLVAVRPHRRRPSTISNEFVEMAASVLGFKFPQPGIQASARISPSLRLSGTHVSPPSVLR